MQLSRDYRLRHQKPSLDSRRASGQAFKLMQRIALNSFKDLGRLLPLVLKRSGVMLVVLHFAREVSSELLNYLTSRSQSSGREDAATLILLVGLNLFFEILWSAVWSFVLISATRAAVRDEPVWSERSLSDLNQLLIEGVRGLAAVVYRLPLFIFPGAVELLRLLFVPHVVLLDPLYARGQVDALTESRKAIKLKWGLILTVTVVSISLSMWVSLLTQSESGDVWLWEAPRLFFLSAFLTLFINLVYEVFLVAFFLRLGFASNQGEPHAHVQLEAN